MSLDTRGVQIPNGSKNPDDEQGWYLLLRLQKRWAILLSLLTAPSGLQIGSLQNLFVRGPLTWLGK